MFQPNNQLPVQTIKDSSALMQVDQTEKSIVVRDEKQNGGFAHAETIIYYSKRLQDDLQMLGMKIKGHEDNIKFLNAQNNKLDDLILGLQVTLGKHHGSSTPKIEIENHSQLQTEDQTTELILQHEKSAAGILCQLKARHGPQASHLQLIKDVLGIVATLGKVDDDNLSRPYAGEFVADDPQRRLDLVKPKLPNGECPPGFLGFAVKMINVDNTNLFCATASGHGLRETLFYNLFSHLQEYRTRQDMVTALPCISDGAVSLNGGMIRSTSVFSLGDREDVDVKFPKPLVT